MSVDDKITQDELFLKFPNGLPSEAFQILWNAEKDLPVAEVRKRIDDWLEKNPQIAKSISKITLHVECEKDGIYVVTSPEQPQLKIHSVYLEGALFMIPKVLLESGVRFIPSTSNG